MIRETVVRGFVLPGTLVCDAIGIRSEDDRSMVWTLVNMLVWNLAVVLVVVLL